MMKLWGYVASESCVLCGADKCTLHHVLVNCKFALDQGRYTWRHDSVLVNIQSKLRESIIAFNRKKPSTFADETRAAFKACFVKAGEKSVVRTAKPQRTGLLNYANDWQLLVDFENAKIVFPPTILATNERPDIVIWSKSARVVIMIELTVCAEEGIAAAQMRKESRYQSLLDNISELQSWRPWLLTLEIGARGLVSSRAFRTFKTLGLSSSETRRFCKSLSTVAARCSYAIFLAHKEYVWHNKDLISLNDTSRRPKRTPPISESKSSQKKSSEPNIKVLRRNDIQTLFHFTDAANLDSIRKHGLMSAATLNAQSITSVMNSDELSRKLDQDAGLQDYVRLSFNDQNPHAVHSARRTTRFKFSDAESQMEVVSRPGVMFSDCNATRNEAVKSVSPDIVRFDIVKAKNQFQVSASLRHFYQAEVHPFLRISLCFQARLPKILRFLWSTNVGLSVVKKTRLVLAVNTRTL